jgi:hypothetical protein
LQRQAGNSDGDRKRSGAVKRASSTDSVATAAAIALLMYQYVGSVGLLFGLMKMINLMSTLVYYQHGTVRRGLTLSPAHLVCNPHGKAF